MQVRLPIDRQAAGSSNQNPHEGKTSTPLNRSLKGRHLRRANVEQRHHLQRADAKQGHHLQYVNTKQGQLTRENENAHDLFGYKKSTQENPCAINIDTLWGQTQLRNASAEPNAGKQQLPSRNSPGPGART